MVELSFVRVLVSVPRALRVRQRAFRLQKRRGSQRFALEVQFDAEIP